MGDMKVLFQSPVDSDGPPHPSLSEGRVYEVLGIEADWFRLLSDRGEPVLFDPNWFRVSSRKGRLVMTGGMRKGHSPCSGGRAGPVARPHRGADALTAIG